MLQFINLFITAALVWGAYKMYQRFVPEHEIPDHAEISSEELHSKYKTYFTLSIFGMIVFIPLLTMGIRFALHYLIVFRLSFLVDASIVVLPHELMFWIIAFLIAYIACFASVTTICYNYILTDWEEYLYYVNQRLRFNAYRFFTRFHRIYSFSLLLLTIMLFDWFSAFGNEEIKINHFWGLGTTKYAYANIAEVLDVEYHKTLFGQIKQTPYYKITFKDGASWNSLYDGFSNETDNDRIIQLVGSRVNVYVRAVDME